MHKDIFIFFSIFMYKLFQNLTLFILSICILMVVAIFVIEYMIAISLFMKFIIYDLKIQNFLNKNPLLQVLWDVLRMRSEDVKH